MAAEQSRLIARSRKQIANFKISTEQPWKRIASPGVLTNHAK
jgi:hypothetical protein